MATIEMLTVLFAVNMCAIDPEQMPEGNAMIVVPVCEDGCWYCACSSVELLNKLTGGDPDAELGYEVGDFQICELQAGNSHAQEELQLALEHLGFQVKFANEPPWLNW
ncbi:hypothetical protein A3K34_04830 [candidate division WWE3 bacterium RIFOXYC1_FULL_40_10]|uniref:Uncharacterized protein n=1 Tax=candidate division WWE3 bacterium RIFOXYA2_FULL_46_9 TaxID=1802636 RepID=A0A1F4W189_UNCKA|nr:MAG: hypothetical protein A3K58_04830 [candidate division WWE3 bacterium RIFOXYB1_FULL_40_22]OGC62162.1 MAG: hypothetical protein A3K37_04830 [candidate division WWE3 bacterium RIFOXYA1_FULL_40_11]OGC63176.1 MAG: hypothetical protein A2264_00580 [candidate division WWE3 bacterium RIFOXYA2_FULL_46_9]OGC65256.1 MAG: hypothetical protein A2326_04215 [candidate division WWE3 bacterium RIFOXYB2_FULL_41_6]OGC66545.1 MAG: hypothetical protein A3K34_04830 [candidate division WWE3 bacterium RIFOXYC1_